MRISNAVRSFESNASLVQHSAKIVASPKMFALLSDKLYTDKPLAILRELSANAYDAHVSAGKADVPFEVVLPTALSTRLIIRDHGIGVPPEKMEDFYLNFGDSDKTLSDDDIGGFGLGCKSPFAYTDQFTVISRYDGTQRTYAVYKNADDIPSISEVSAIATDECNGLEVQVPVKDSDVGTFKATANRLFRFFPVQPIINTELDSDLGEELLRIDEPDFSAVLYAGLSSPVSVQGPIAYPIDESVLRDHYGADTDDGKLMRRIFSRGWALFTKIGALDITPSREALSYDRTTIDRLRTMALKMAAELHAHVTQQVASQPDLISAVNTAAQLRKKLGAKKTLTAITWNGLDLPTDDQDLELDIPDGLRIRRVFKDYYGSWYKQKSRLATSTHDDHIDLNLRETTTAVFRAQKLGAYKKYFEANPLEKNEQALILLGEDRVIDDFIKTYRLANVLPFPKVAVNRSHASTSKSSGSTLYNAYDVSRGANTCLTLDTLLQRAPTVIIAQDRYTTAEQIHTAHRIQTLTVLPADLLIVEIPFSHTRVRETLVTELLAMAPSEFFDAYLDKNKLEHYIATTTAVDALLSHFRDTWHTVETRIDATALTPVEPRFQQLINLVRGIQSRETSATDLNNLARAAGVDTGPGTTPLAQHPYHALSQALSAEYQDLLADLKVLDYSLSYVTTTNKPNMVRIVTEWFTHRLIAQLSANKEAA